MFKPQDPDQFGTTISRIWTFVFFTMIFRDLHEMSTARTIEGILDGRFEGNPVTDAGLAIGGVVLVLLLLTSFLSNLLKAEPGGFTRRACGQPLPVSERSGRLHFGWRNSRRLPDDLRAVLEMAAHHDLGQPK